MQRMYEPGHSVFPPKTSRSFACKRERVRHRICKPCFTASVTDANNCLLFILGGLFDMNTVAQFIAQHAHSSKSVYGSDV